MDKKVVLKFNYQEKLDLLKKISHEIKKKRFILNDSVEKFGFDDLSLLTKVKNTSQIKGYPMVASKITSKILKGVKIGLKVVPVETKYPKDEHPSNLEIIALKELTKEIVCKNISPHIAYYLGSQKVSNKCKALKFLNLKRLEVEELVRTHSNILISEFIEGNSLDTWVYDTYEDDNSISDDEWRMLVFQITYTLAILQKKYRFMHNDMHYGNILVDTSLKKEPGQYFVYSINNKKYYIPNLGYLVKFWDFEFAMAYSDKIPDYYPNKFIIGKYTFDRKNFVTKEHSLELNNNTDDSTEFNVPYNYNEVYDLHYFLTSLLDLYISQELFDWIVSIYPDELIPMEESSDYTTNSDSDSNSDSNLQMVSEIKEEDTSEIKLKKKLERLNVKDIDYSSKDIVSKSESQSSNNSNNSNNFNNSNSSNSSNSSNVESSSSDNIYDRYLADGRIKNGIDEEFSDLPIPIKLLDNDFFGKFTKKPVDFDESKAIYFDSGI